MINYQAVNDFIGKPWVYIENDCWAVVKQASKIIFGVEIVDQISFSAKPDNQQAANIVKGQQKRPCWVRSDKVEPGNIVVFSDAKGNPQHVGICIESNNILHCMGGNGVKNGKTRYDKLSLVCLIYKHHESYRYVNNDN